MTEALPTVAEPSTLEGVAVRRGVDTLMIITDSWCCEEAFHDAISASGVWGSTTYETIYDPGTGRETFIFYA